MRSEAPDSVNITLFCAFSFLPTSDSLLKIFPEIAVQGRPDVSEICAATIYHGRSCRDNRPIPKAQFYLKKDQK